MVDNETLIRYITGDLPDEGRREVCEWIASSEENLSEYRALRRIHDMSLWKVPYADGRRRMRVRRFVTAFAAVAAVLVVAGIMFALGRESAPPPPLYLRSVTAPPGKELSMNLDDGTQVWLNSNSTLTVGDVAKDGVRRVFLDGEGYFKVAHDSSRPFIVHAGELAVKVLGTEFNVVSNPSKNIWETALFEGSVAILNKEEKELLTIAPGTMVSRDGNRLVASSLNANRYLWKDGVLYFDNMSLRNIFDFLGEYYDITFRVPGSIKLDKRYTGKFRSVDGYDHILKVLQTDNGFTYKIRHESGETFITINV